MVLKFGVPQSSFLKAGAFDVNHITRNKRWAGGPPFETVLNFRVAHSSRFSKGG
jgi:hypothetical protein